MRVRRASRGRVREESRVGRDVLWYPAARVDEDGVQAEDQLRDIYLADASEIAPPSVAYFRE